MGYTHYWYRPKEVDSNNFSLAIKDIALMFFSDTHADDNGVGRRFTDIIDVFDLNERKIDFNGIGEDGHENFKIEVEYNPESYEDEVWKFDCCKTSFENYPFKAYDKYVVACLYIFKYHLGDEFLITSDGALSDWTEGIQMVQDNLGYPYNIRDFKFNTFPKDKELIPVIPKEHGHGNTSPYTQNTHKCIIESCCSTNGSKDNCSICNGEKDENNLLLDENL
jgi:hypothetical protein